MNKWLPIIGAILVLAVAGGIIVSLRGKPSGSLTKPTPTPEVAQQLTPDQKPEIKIAISSDAHFATVTLSNLHADALEYNLIYDATVKGNRINTGVNSTANISGKSSFSQKQLLGSESSGKFTYHDKIANATMELTLRDAAGRSIFTSTYSFEVKAGSTQSLTASE